MRCPNCGFQNPETSVVCVECKSSMSGDIVAERGGPASDQAPRRSSTIPVAPTNQQAWDAPAVHPGQEPYSVPVKPSPFEMPEPSRHSSSAPQECPHCHYVLVLSASICPSCHKPLDALPQSNPATLQEAIHGNETQMADPNTRHASSGRMHTIDPYRESPNVTAWLRPVPKTNEPASPAPVQLDSEHGPHELSREQLDPGNKTITGAVQAELEYRDGQWYLVDRSGQQTTFVQAGQPVALHKGDVVLMGDRKFIFDC